MTTLSDLAAPLVAKGMPVFPCWEKPNGKHPNGKNPRTARGFKDATTDAGQIAAWAALYSLGVPEWPYPGFVTGKEGGGNVE